MCCFKIPNFGAQITSMALSMTGFGKAEGMYGNKKIVVELKSLNSKQLDISTRIPGSYKAKEIELKNQVGTQLERGKVDIVIFLDSGTDENRLKLNRELIMSYHNDLVEIASTLGETENVAFLPLILKMPDVLKAEKDEMDEQEWKEVQKLVDQACEQLIEFRKAEGNTLKKDLAKRINFILDNLDIIANSDKERIERIKVRIRQNLEDVVGKSNIDLNRFEQELIYYIEKLDITEEKIRLKTHCDYFLEVMNGTQSQGKKLGFIGQELGREINTIGSKANNAEIQKRVVEMKDELEKIKEQVLNLL